MLFGLLWWTNIVYCSLSDNILSKHTNIQVYSITEWLVGAGDANGIKSVTGFYPEESSDSNGIYGFWVFAEALLIDLYKVFIISS